MSEDTPVDWRTRWYTGLPIKDDLDYYRNDEKLVEECLGPAFGQTEHKRVIAARRFGKTSFLMRLERRAPQFGWKPVHLLDFQFGLAKVKRATLAVKEALASDNSEAGESQRILILIDEFNKLLMNEEKIRLVQPLFERALLPSNGRCTLRVVIASASNMDDMLNAQNCLLPSNLIDSLLNLRKLRIVALSDAEKTALMSHAKRTAHPLPDIDAELKAFAGNHPLFIQYVCDAHFNHDIETYDEFRSYMRDKQLELDQRSIYEDLSKHERLMLRYLLHHERAGDHEFTDYEGGFTLNTLKSFGLVKGHANRSHSIESPFLVQYMKNRPENREDPLYDNSNEVRALWPDLFTKIQPGATSKDTSWIIHHLGNLHVRTSRIDAQRRESGKKVELDSKVWTAYRKYPKQSRDPLPRIVVATGDLILNDLDALPMDQFDAASATFRLIRSELKDVSSKMERIDVGARQIIYVPGDTDVLIREADQKADFEQNFSSFDSCFEDWDKWQFFRDFPLIIAPMNSARLPPEASEQLKCRYGLWRGATSDTDTTTLFERYKRYQKTDFGCLAANPKALKELEKQLEQQNDRLREQSGDGDEFKHALRIGVFHHQLEQMTNAHSVDFWGSHRIKEILAENEFSIALNAHTLRPFIHSDRIYNDKKIRLGWDLHSIGCGSMSKRFVGDAFPPSFQSISIGAKLLQPVREGVKYKFSISVEEVQLIENRFWKQEPKHTFEVIR